MYLEAIKYAGLEEQISTGNRTRIIPTNDAIKSVLSSAGVEQINQLSKGSSAIYFSYLTFDGTYRSIDMETDQSVKGISDSGEPIFLTRKEGASDKFLLYVNDSKRNRRTIYRCHPARLSFQGWCSTCRRSIAPIY